jgi:hypothetical protein
VRRVVAGLGEGRGEGGALPRMAPQISQSRKPMAPVGEGPGVSIRVPVPAESAPAAVPGSAVTCHSHWIVPLPSSDTGHHIGSGSHAGQWVVLHLDLDGMSEMVT